MCKFIYTNRCEKITKVCERFRFVYLVLLFLIGIDSLSIELIEPSISHNIICWITVVIAIVGGALEFYKVKHISTPSVDFTLQYDEINTDDKLQISVIKQAIDISTEWAGFALKQKKKQHIYDGIWQITFAVLLIFCLVIYP